MDTKRDLTISLIAIAIIVSAFNTGFNPASLGRGLPNLFELASEMFPPDTTLLATAFWSIMETIQMAFLGTILGMLISMPLGLMGSRNLFDKHVCVPIRALLGIVRTIPSLLWAVFFVIAVGLGPFAGVLAITMYSVGYLTKLQYESIEAIDPEAYEAVRAIGTSKAQIIRFVVLPQAAPHLLSQVLFMFEYNVRASTILGFVGAGGVGFYMMNYLNLLEYDKVMTFLLIILATVLIIDWTSTIVRDRFIIPMQKRR